MFGLRQIIICSIFIWVAINSAFATADATSNRIDAVAEFLVDRANDNFMYILQQDMKNNSLLECYLPSTYKYASSNNLQLLFQSSSNLWEQSVKKDLEGFGGRLIFKEINPDTLKNWAASMDNKYIETLQKVKIKIDGKTYPVDQLPLDASPELKAAVNGFYKDYLDGRSKVDAIIADIQNARTSTSCTSASYVPIDTVLLNLKAAVDSFKNQLAQFKNVDVVWAGGESISDSLGASLYDSLISLVALEQSLKDLKGKIEAIPKSETPFNKMFQLDQLIRDEIASDTNPLKTITDMQEYNRFSKYALSLAMLSDTKDPKQAKAVLQQLALPPVSFGVKREPDAKKLMITAYFGAQAGAEKGLGGYGGLTVPVGVEYSKGLRSGGVMSVMLAPFDFAHPVNQIINNNTGSSTLKDVVNPGMYISYGIKKYPMIWGAGVSRGQTLSQAQFGNKWRYFVFLGMDMPLFGFY